MKFIERAALPTVRELSAQFPAVLVCGARQVGKTTLLRNAAEKGRTFVSLDDPEYAPEWNQKFKLCMSFNEISESLIRQCS